MSFYFRNYPSFEEVGGGFLKRNSQTFGYIQNITYLCSRYAPVAELVDALDLGSSNLRCAGSSPVRRTEIRAG